jgi:hypothetical protein
MLMHTGLPLPQLRCSHLTLPRQLLAIESSNRSLLQRGIRVGELGNNRLETCTCAISQVHSFAANHRHQHFLATKELFRHCEVVVLEHDDVGEFALLQRTDFLVSSEKFRAVCGDCAERGFAREAFSGKFAVVRRALGRWGVGVLWVTFARHADLEGEEFIERINLLLLSEVIQFGLETRLTGQSLPYTTGRPAFSI